MSGYSINKPANYKESFYGSINDSNDVEKIIGVAENTMKTYEEEMKIGVFGNMEDVDNRNLVVYKVYVSLRKVGKRLSSISITEETFHDITKDRFDEWNDRFEKLREKQAHLNNRFLSRPDGF